MGIKIDGLDEAIKRIDGFPQRLDDAIDEFLYDDLAYPISRMARSRGRTVLGAHAAGTITARQTGYGALLNNDGGDSLGRIVFAGSEFGGRKRRTTYARRSKNGVAHTVHRRRTTMQFPPFLGTTGYMLWPSIRRVTDGVSTRVESLVEGLIEGTK